MDKDVKLDLDFDGGELDFGPSLEEDVDGSSTLASGARRATGAGDASDDEDLPVRVTRVGPKPHGVGATIHRPATPTRDRIVILGRRAAGKTIFLARLYDELWQGRDGMSVRALNGQSHRACMEVISELKAGRWPPSTLGSTYMELEISLEGERHRLLALDYPGEVFRRAFVDGVDAPDTRELIEHVDHASAVLLLIDPGVAVSGDYDDFIDDDFGMAQAIHRLRDAPEGSRIPVAVLFTKCDLNRAALREAGGLRAFCKRHYRGLLRGVQLFRLYGTVAVHAVPVASGRLIPQLERAPIGVVEPLRFCLEMIRDTHRADDSLRRAEAAAHQRHVAVMTASTEQRRTIIFWSIAAALTLFVFGLVTLLTLFLSGLL